MTKKLKLGTRGSQLALWQAHHVQALLLEKKCFDEVEIVTIKTSGDINQKDKIKDIGGKAVFVKELEEALFDKRIDIAVHSSKDMAAALPEGLICPVYLGGASRFDAFISKKYQHPSEMPEGSILGTGSLRRRYQFESQYPKVTCKGLRGNVDTRLRKCEEGEYDAIILASAGLDRLGLSHERVFEFNEETMIPAGGQGIIAIQSREEDSEINEALLEINDQKATLSAILEFGFLKAMEADCHTPIGVYATQNEAGITMAAFYATDDGSKKMTMQESYSKEVPMIQVLQSFVSDFQSKWKDV